MDLQQEENKISIALISVLPPKTGTTVVVEYYYRALKDLGYKVEWYQLALSDDLLSYPRADKVIEASRFIPKVARIPFDIVFTLPKNVRSFKHDIVIITDPVASNLAKYHPNSIVIVHDLRDLTNINKNVIRRLYFEMNLRNLKYASQIITISDFTKKLLFEKLNVKKNVTTIPSCISSCHDDAYLFDRIKNGISKKPEITILYVAADRPYKNIELFLRIALFYETQTKGSKYKFILVSRIKKNTERHIKRIGVSNLQVVADISDINEIYRKSDILLFPSTIEGFGLPLIEAMSHAIPVVHSSLSPMTEIVDNGGIFANPAVLEDWIKAIDTLSNNEFYKTKAKMAYERSKTFSYASFMENLRETMHEFCNSKLPELSQFNQ